MKNILNFSKLVIASIAVTSVFSACSDEISENSYSTQYVANVSNITSAGEAVDLGLPSGTKWASKNVGAASETDNGILFVWGDVTGTQILPKSQEYSVNPSSEAELFEKFKGETKETGYLYDTTKVYNLDIKVVADVAEKSKEKVDSIVAANLNAYQDKVKGKLVVAVDTTDLKLCISIDAIDSTAVQYFSTKEGTFDQANGADIKGIALDDLIGNVKYDPATANWGASWTMPTKAQIDELIKECTWEFTGAGYKVTGSNGNSIFLPAAGFRYGQDLVGVGNAGYYATGSIIGDYRFPSMAEQLQNGVGETSNSDKTPNVLVFQHGDFDNSIKVINNFTSNFAFSVRPVTK